MKKETKTDKEETGIEMLARLVADGFEKNEENFKQLKQEISSVKQDISSVKQEIITINDRLDGIDSRLANIGTEQVETNRRLSSLERKQLGTILSLDETVHRNEFARLEKRVEALEN